VGAPLVGWMPAARAVAAVAAAVATLAAVLVVADGVDPLAGPSAASAARPATEPAPGHPPVLAVPAGAAAVLGRPVEVAVRATDPDGGTVTVAVAGLPAGASFDAGAGVVRWSPAPGQAGTWPLRVEAVDGDGLAATATVDVRARAPAHPAAYLALGDSVASGYGLDRTDYLGGDGCGRAEGEAYPARAAAGLGRPGVDLVACSGATADDVRTDPVPGPDGLVGDGRGDRSQLDWAVDVNPGLVTLTVGANDLRFFAAPELIGAGGAVDGERLAGRLTDLSGDLDHLLGRLVSATDATVVVTTYHDPTAATPHGIAGCEGACFARAAAGVVDALDATLAEVAGRFGDRVVLADVRPAFAGHGAGNGLGPDGLRAGELPSWVPTAVTGVVDGLSGVTPFCADGHPGGEPWVSSFDCVHPNGSGADAYAAAVVAALSAD
jgi:lysophospholipase L1-like esterase